MQRLMRAIVSLAAVLAASMPSAHAQEGEHADLFASANMEHPQTLHGAARALAPRRFARNALCALVAPAVDVRSGTLVQRLLDPAIRVGTSTPKADPSGDYAWQLFERIERSGVPDAFAAFLLEPAGQAVLARHGFAPR